MSAPAADVRFVIITKNGAGWLNPILDGYRRLHIEPFVILDESSSDGTEDILKRRSIGYAKARAEHPRVEALIKFVPELVPSKWVVRLDDDELPNRSLCEWVLAGAQTLPYKAVGFQRRTIRIAPSGRCEYSRHPTIVSRLGVLDAQWRMFQPDAVSYMSDIHTPGFRVPAGSPIAPRRAFIAHFTWLVRGLADRREQVARYDLQAPDAGSRFRDVSLWEESDIEAHRFAPMETDEFDAAVAALRRSGDDDPDA
ncbi:hypothetical protein [Bradyrhizobium sp.]|uniref:hypothetical protein n=1 Tax=Bradyrhizobium sp. TaxID=376 RepID=UPI0039E4EC3F